MDNSTNTNPGQLPESAVPLPPVMPPQPQQPQQPQQPNAAVQPQPIAQVPAQNATTAPQLQFVPNGVPMQQPAQPLPAQMQQPAPQMQPAPQPPLQQPQQPILQQTQQQAPQQAQQQLAGRPAGQPGQPGLTGQPLRPMTRPLAGQPGGPNPKKLLLGCLGFVAFSILLFIVFVLFYVSQTSATGTNGMATALGVDPGEFTNTLILLTNLIFGAVVMIAFFVAVFGLFKGAMAPKTDKPSRSQGFKQAAIAGAILLLTVMIWVFVFLYLNGKQVNIPKASQQTAGIVTTPAETVRLVAPVDVKFDATQLAIPKNIEITFYQWDFGDGSSSTAPVVTHTYRDVGQYDVKLTLTGRNTTTDETSTETLTKLVTVIDVQVSSSFSFTPETGPAPLKVSFDASASSSPAGQITSYEWDFRGQNNFRDADGEKAEYTFSGEGEYKVKLRVTDNTGKSAISEREIQVTGPDVPVAVIDIPTTDGKYYIGKQMTFLAEQSTSPTGEVVKYEWDFGDGTPKANTRTASHTYQAGGLYEVILKVTDDAGKTGQASEKITVGMEKQAPQAVITTVPAVPKDAKSISGTAPFEVNFDASKSTDPNDDIVEYKWDFDGDGTTDANGTTAAYIFKTAGSYNASLTAVDAAGLQSSTVLIIKVLAQDLTARLTADKLEGTQPLTVTFDASASSYPDGQITSYEWDFGDGSPKLVGAAQVSYKYTAIGTFTAKVNAKASDGKSDMAEIVINIRPVSLQACFTPSAEEGPAPLTVEFDPRCSQGAVAKHLWDFGDGETSRTRKPTHIFAKPGSYQVTLEVTDNQNVVNTFSKNILVTGEIQ